MPTDSPALTVIAKAPFTVYYEGPRERSAHKTASDRLISSQGTLIFLDAHPL